MKKALCFFVSLALLVSCKKEKVKNPEELRLTKVYSTDGTDQYASVFSYNSNGKIIVRSGVKNKETPVPNATVSYNGNEAIITMNQNNAGVVEETEIRIVFDNEGKALTRIQRTFMEYRGPNIPQRDYINDTLIFEYDAQGLLKRTTGNRFDSTWFNPNNLQIESLRSHSITDYTVTNGNISNSTKATVTKGLGLQNGVSYYFYKTDEDTYTYEYTKQFPNKTDFSNSALLNEFEFLPFMLNKHNKNMPDKISWSLMGMDQNGFIISSSNGSRNLKLEFDSRGFLSSVAPNPLGQTNEKFYLNYE